MVFGGRKLKFSTLKFAFLALLSFLPGNLIAGSIQECLVCHGEKSLTTTRKGRTVSLFVDAAAFKGSAHGQLECVSCHAGFNPADLPHARKIRRVNCLSCHSDEQFEHFRNSVHGVAGPDGRPRVECSDCHSTHAVKNVSSLDPLGRKEFAIETCGRCHADVDAKYMKSDHGRALASGVKGAPSCIDCHGEHEVASPAADSARTGRTREAAMCLKCHLDDPEVRARVAPSAAFISSYENSVHGQAVRGGNKAAAVCTDCHGSHDMERGSMPSSRVSKANIASTCGTCHPAIESQYEGSIHGVALAKGVAAAPTCTDCHGEHNILSPKDVRAPVAAQNVSVQVCSPCHASVKLARKYGLSSDRFQSFADSYHGLASRAGDVEVANCASCHGVHDIKPSSDPTSRINKANLAKTCGTCHPGANENFARGDVHITATSDRDSILYLIATGYIILIAVVVGGMVIHNMLDFVRKGRRHLLVRRGILEGEHAGHRLYLRMSLNERIQHGTLMLSFATLVFTGFALKFPDAWWVVPWRSISPIAFELRGLLHRAAAVVLVGAGLYHLYYISFTTRGRRLFADLLPVRRDLTDALMVMKYNLGLSRQKPAFGRFSYVEKSEYWALIWGTVVMGITGTILWFDNTFLGLLTKLGWDIARTVHYYEAWLATLSILAWHLYFVIFNPDVYPINLAFWKGTLTEEEMKEEHPEELARLQEMEAAEAPDAEVEAVEESGEVR